MSKRIRINNHKKKTFSIIRNRNKKFNFQNIKTERYKIFLLIIAIISMLFGSLYYSISIEITSLLIDSIREKINILLSGNYIFIFINLIKVELVFIISSFLIGTSFIGSSISFIPIVTKCFLIGFLGSYMYNEFELKGVLFCLVLIYPYLVFTTATLIFALNESIYMSKYNYNLITNKNTVDDISVRLYLLRYLILTCINTIITGINSWFIVILANKINLYSF